MASQFPPKKNTAFTLHFTLYKSDGTVIVDPGTYTKKVSIDGGAVADIAANVTENDTTYGHCQVVLATGEMNGDRIWIYIKDNTAGCVPFTVTIYTAANLLDDIKVDTAAILDDTGTTLDGRIPAALGADGFMKASLFGAMGTALTETAGQIAAAIVKFFNKATPTGTINSLPDAVAGAANGLPVIDATGVKLTKTVDLTSGQSIAASSVPTVVLANSASHGGAAAVITLLTPITATVPNTQKVDVETIKTQTVTCAAATTILASVGASAAPGANGGLPTTNGTKVNQTVDLTAVQTGVVIPRVTLVDTTTTNTDLATVNAQLAVIGAEIGTPGLGAGAITWPYTVTLLGTTTPIADVDVWITTDSAGATIVASGRTNQYGIVTFYLDAGTVYVWRQKTGYNFTNPDTEVVS